MVGSQPTVIYVTSIGVMFRMVARLQWRADGDSTTLPSALP